MQVLGDFDVIESTPFRGVLGEGLLWETFLNTVGPPRNRRRKLQEAKSWAGKKCQTEVVITARDTAKSPSPNKGSRGTVVERWVGWKKSRRRAQTGLVFGPR